MKNKRLLFLLLEVVLLCNCREKDEVSDSVEPSTAPPIFNPSLLYGTMSDQEGNSYKTITIGSQTWMAENLRTTKYRNGDQIANFTAISGQAPSGGTYSNYDNQLKYVPVYGRLYDLAAVQSNKNLAPVGWRIPDDKDWKTLIMFLDPEARTDDPISICYSLTAGEKIKESSREHWVSVNEGTIESTNASGFTALPGGRRERYADLTSSYYIGIQFNACWWSAEGHCFEISPGIWGGMNYVILGQNQSFPVVSASVRCIRIN